MSKIPNSILNQYLDCSDCMGTMLVADAFDTAFQSWPQQMWIAYRCSTCETVNYLALGQNTLTQGYIDDIPGPHHVPRRTIVIRKLSVAADKNSVRIKTLNQSWNIPESP